MRSKPDTRLLVRKVRNIWFELILAIRLRSVSYTHLDVYKRQILNYKFEENEKKQGTIKIALKYNSTNKLSAIRTLDRVSKPGLRKYSGVDTMPKVLNGLGIAIISTSKGVMTDKEAKKLNVGGEVLCYIS